MIKEQKHSSGAPARKVLLAGYYGFGNAGDEAILSVIVEDLGRLAGPIDIVVVSGDPEATTKSYNLRAVRFTDIARIIDEIETCDLVILGGGGLFQDYWGFDPTNLLTRNYTNIAYYGTMAVLATILDKHLMLYSVGVGPLFSQPSREHTRLSFEQASRATVRDAESRALLAACGLDPSRVEVCADPAFRLEPASKQEARNILKAEGLSMNGEPLIGVSLRSWSMGASIEHWTREVAKALDWFVSRHNARLLFLPLQTTGEHLTDDSAISKQVIDQLRKKELAHIIRGEYRAREIAGLLAVCDMVVGMRLHSIIFAANSSVPAVGLVYDEKVRIVMKQLKCDRLAIDLGAVTAGDLLRAMEQAYADREAISTSLRTYHEELALRSERSSILAAELLKELPQKLRPLPIDIQDLLKQAALNLADQIEVREKTIDRLKAELKDLALSSAEKDQNISSLLGQLDERRQAAGAFAGLLSEKEQTIGSLSESLTRLRRRAAEDEKLIDELNSLISDLQSQILEQLEKFVEKQSQVDSL
ncbi:MAG TPA: polysaccharide pyruvyl transferase CsaB, partial [Blastocatellia bacterium]|nr:polysaccharide pyruvyl transferase CsaB [Blastocatellia bacterium]